MELSPEDLVAIERTLLLLGPLFVAGVLVLLYRPTARQATAAMVTFLWQLPVLLLVHLIAAHLGFWSFAAPDNHLAGHPIDVWIGWAVWWGPVAFFLRRWLSIPVVILLFVALDFVSMPLLRPLVVLDPAWFIGELPAVLIALVPGLVFARLTETDRLPRLRASFHCFGWGGYMLLVIPLVALSAEGRNPADLLVMPQSLAGWLLMAGVALLLFIGIAATAEFAIVGSGTPIPLDPPKRVVTTGPYAFLANPMQTICAMLMLLLAIYFASWGLALVSLSFLVFDLVYAAWYNRVHIARAMSEEWNSYQANIPYWRPQWRPYIDGETQLTISPSGPMRIAWDVVWPRLSKQLVAPIEIREHAEDAVPGRLLYERKKAGVSDTGIIALARLLEHGPAPLATIGLLIRFPLLGSALQLASGLVIRVFRL